MIQAGILPLEIQLLSLAVLGAFLAWVIWLIRTKRLHLRESLTWLLTTIAAIVVTSFPQLLVAGAHALGFQVPANALFGAGLLYLAVNVLAGTIAASASTARTRRLAQECALLRADIDELRSRIDDGQARRPLPAPERAEVARTAR